MTVWKTIDSFDRAENRGSYLFAFGENVILGHWHEGEDEPRMAYTGQEFPFWPTHWTELPPPPDNADV